MRLLTFEANDLSRKRFEYLFRGLVIIGNQNTQKGFTVLAREIAVLDKLEAISRPYPCGKKVPGSAEADRELLEVEAGAALSVRLEDPEFDLLFDYVGKVPWSIGESSRGAIKALEWLRNPAAAAS